MVKKRRGLGRDGIWGFKASMAGVDPTVRTEGQMDVVGQVQCLYEEGARVLIVWDWEFAAVDK